MSGFTTNNCCNLVVYGTCGRLFVSDHQAPRAITYTVPDRPSAMSHYTRPRIVCMTARLDVTPKITEQNWIVNTHKFEAEVTNNKTVLEVLNWSDRAAFLRQQSYTCFLHHWGIGHFRTFVSISLFSQFSYNQQPMCTILGELTDADEIIHPQFWDGYDGHPNLD